MIERRCATISGSTTNRICSVARVRTPRARYRLRFLSRGRRVKKIREASVASRRLRALTSLSAGTHTGADADANANANSVARTHFPKGSEPSGPRLIRGISGETRTDRKILVIYHGLGLFGISPATLLPMETAQPTSSARDPWEIVPVSQPTSKQRGEKLDSTSVSVGFRFARFSWAPNVPAVAAREITTASIQTEIRKRPVWTLVPLSRLSGSNKRFSGELPKTFQPIVFHNDHLHDCVARSSFR